MGRISSYMTGLDKKSRACYSPESQILIRRGRGMRGSFLLGIAALGACGCIPERRTSDYVPDDPVLASPSTQVVQANTEACTRVFGLGQRILSSNKDLPSRIVFRAAGQPTPEIFHQGSSSIVITQKMIEMCKTDGELAAVLCLELGKMAAERIALSPTETWDPEIRQPIDPGPMRDVAGVANNIDPMRLAERAMYEEDQKRSRQGRRLPDPSQLARGYLHRAGFSPDELDRIKPILRAAADHSSLERQMTSAPRTTPFSPTGN